MAATLSINPYPAIGRSIMTMVVACALCLPAVASAQDAGMTPIAIPAQPNAIDLGTGALPDAAAQESWHRQYSSRFARNVVSATLTPFLPDPENASGAAIIVAPGGGFQTLSMDNEGYDVAKALAAKGVAAFVIKYRLRQTPKDITAFEKSMQKMLSSAARPSPALSPANDATTDLAIQLADSTAAFRLIRSRAAQWHIDSDRIGMIGFSAGAMLTMATTLSTTEAKPAFIGNIYGPLRSMSVPPDAPPLFAAIAADDPLFGNRDFSLINDWRAARRPVEFHLYERGGHGFGMYPKPTTSTGWFDAFVRWLDMHGMLKSR